MFTYCKTCPVWQVVKQSTPKTNGNLKCQLIYKTFCTYISMDFSALPEVTELSTRYTFDHLLVIVDWCSKYTISITIPANYSTTYVMCAYYWHGLPHCRLPEDIVRIEDPNFTSLQWRQFCRTYKINQSISRAYNLQTDGQTEVGN